MCSLLFHMFTTSFTPVASMTAIFKVFLRQTERRRVCFEADIVLCVVNVGPPLTKHCVNLPCHSLNAHI